MSAGATRNPFAPPRPDVDDHLDLPIEMVDASRGARFGATVLDGVIPVLAGAAIAAAVAIPAYQRYKERHAPGIEPPPLGSEHHLLAGMLAFVGGISLLAFVIYTAVLVYRFGQTLGKRTMGIRVVRTDGSRVTFNRFVFLRGLPLVVVFVIPWVGLLGNLLDALLIFRDSRRCLHDNIADTMVVTAASSEAATLSGGSGANLRTISF